MKTGRGVKKGELLELLVATVTCFAMQIINTYRICICSLILYLYHRNGLRVFELGKLVPLLLENPNSIHCSTRPDSHPTFTERPLNIPYPSLGILFISVNRSTIYPPYASDLSTKS